ncbi:hypothetical protein BKP45_05530 [Anaerobacillus alkalidiazotrophicus]|uniref:Diacylglycerol kinase n=1 Tax=Anaerobacillus alkalidiazotrophicus TaxID=472963 RepID=A0A1S2MEM2_9BACI|nr:diacylglycerol kinase family protein [Anaerobacillus alkalidiazotrophicus]OIJ22135.1 hypothetical protein BKP45_05530 [Anaerobacillus alkalidiazotrophicus]
MDYKNSYDRYWKRFIWSFIFAWSGLKNAFRHEQNIRIHFTIGLVIIVLSFLLNIPLFEKIILLLVIGVIISLEVMNTAIERVVDLVTKEYHPLARIAKDVSAGAVLIFSMFAVIIGILIFYKPVVELISNYIW